MANGKQTTNDNLATLLNNTRLELKADINAARAELLTNTNDLRRQFETLEAGRLTRAEGNINTLGLDLQKAVNQLSTKIDNVKTSGKVLSTKAAVIGGIIVLIITPFLAALFYRFIVGVNTVK